jgi:hypothetical protein
MGHRVGHCDSTDIRCVFFREEVNRRYEDWDRVYCSIAETDANMIAAAISDYFADPEHTILPTIKGDSEYLGYTLTSGDGQNIAWVTGDYESTITIVVQDVSGKCPQAYQERFAQWDSGKYTITIE